MSKKITAMLTACVLTLSCISMVSCSSAEISEDSGIGRYTDVEVKNTEDLIYPAVYVRTDGTSDATYPHLITISTREELEKYTSDNETVYDFETNSYSVSFYDTVTKYDTAFFENNSLIIVLLAEPSGSYTHSNRGFSESDGGYTLNLIRFIPSDGTDDTATWHIFFEIPKTSPVLGSDIEISITDENTSV